MCGFAGYWLSEKNNTKIISNEIIRNMLSLQKHRGPDDSGIVGINTKTSVFEEVSYNFEENFKKNVDLLFGFNRLSILDLSENGHQPMLSPDNKIVLLFNGEVYNAFDFKDELIEKGHSFISKTDTEVILHLYMEFGIEGMLTRLNGMFAIAIYDFNIKKLFLTRDRFGIKPLYFIKQDQFFAFSSEIKSFKSIPNFKLQLDENKLHEFLLFRYVVKDTLFKDVVSCLPGTYIEINSDQKFQTHVYYDINNEGKGEIENEPIKEVLKKSFHDSVISQMISDVKLGCQLSGGIDSSLITFYANEVCKDNQLETISIIFNNPEFSEKKWIDIVAKQLNLFSHQFTMDSNYFFSELKNVIWHFEHPISHPNAIGIYLLSKEAKKHVTVLLSGEGADECFGGYHKFSTPLVNKRTEVKRIIKQLLRKKIKFSEIDFEYLRFCTGKDNTFIMTSAYSSKKQAEKVFKKFSLQKALKTRKCIIKALNGDSFQRKRKYEMLTYLPELLLRQDKMSMAHSIENRVPFLDNKVVSIAFKTPENELIVDRKINNKTKKETKFALKEICKDIFSDDFAFRSKMGFSIPEVEFMSSDICQHAWKDSIKPGIKKRGLFNVDYLDEIMNNLSNANSDALVTLFLMFSFEIWAQQYLD